MIKIQATDLYALAECVADRVAAKLAHGGDTSLESDDGRLVDEREAATILAVRPATLAAWRCKGGGPVFLKIGSGKRASIRYRIVDLRQWADARRYSNTGHRLGPKEG